MLTHQGLFRVSVLWYIWVFEDFQMPSLIRALYIRSFVFQVQLPASCGDDLMAQHATKNGLMYFELLTASGARTHASVLEFSAPPGTIALPQQTARSLFGPGASPHGTLQVTYTTLPKGVHKFPSFLLFRGLCLEGSLTWETQSYLTLLVLHQAEERLVLLYKVVSNCQHLMTCCQSSRCKFLIASFDHPR